MNLGERIKNIRKQRDYTLKELAEKTGLSIGFLSNIERNQNSPSISNLQQICSALNINLMEILDENTNKEPVTRVNQRNEIFRNNNSSLKVESLFNGKATLNGIAITIENSETNFNDMTWGHSYDEIGIVIKGELEIEVDRVVYNLKEGDSIYIAQGTPHRYKNPSSEQSLVYWFSNKK